MSTDDTFFRNGKPPVGPYREPNTETYYLCAACGNVYHQPASAEQWCKCGAVRHYGPVLDTDRDRALRRLQALRDQGANTG